MEIMSKGKLDRGKIMKRLDGFLTLEIDRKLFALPLKDEKKAGETTGKSKLANY